jgi:hypothetical protein
MHTQDASNPYAETSLTQMSPAFARTVLRGAARRPRGVCDPRLRPSGLRATLDER